MFFVFFFLLFLVFVNYPSALRIGWRVCGSMRTLPIGTLEMSVTAQTSPDADAVASGAEELVGVVVVVLVVVAFAIGVAVAAVAGAPCCC